MKVLSTILASTVLAASAGAALADTIGSYGQKPGTTGYTAPSSYVNSVLTYTGSTFTPIMHSPVTTYDVSPGGIWTAPIGGSSYVSLAPTDGPSGNTHEPDGSYTLQTTFSVTNAASEVGSITILADDTASVYLNGNLLQAAAPADPAAHCTVKQPNCITPLDVTLSGFVNGVNDLTFVVDQDFDHATGLDFQGTIGTAVTPEPSSLLLLGSGLSTMAGFAFRRRKLA